MLFLSTPSEICAMLALRLRAVRLQRNVSQQDLAQRVGTSLSTIRRFEAQGQGTLDLVMRIAQALHCTQGLDALFVQEPQSIADLQMQSQGAQRQRARKAVTVKEAER